MLASFQLAHNVYTVLVLQWDIFFGYQCIQNLAAVHSRNRQLIVA